MDIKKESSLHSPTVNDVSDTVLTVYSVTELMNKTTFQCEFTVVPPVFSTVGILIVMGKLCVIVIPWLQGIFLIHPKPKAWAEGVYISKIPSSHGISYIYHSHAAHAGCFYI